MIDSLWTEELPDQVYDWLDNIINTKALDVISLSIRVKRKHVCCHDIDLAGVRCKATYYIVDRGSTIASE
jgi:hypothetical protein